MSSIVDTMAKGWFHRAVVDKKSAYTQGAMNVNLALLDLRSVYLCPLGWQVLGNMVASLHVKLIRLRKVFDHCTRPGRSTHFERVVAPEKPPGEPETGNAHD